VDHVHEGLHVAPDRGCRRRPRGRGLDVGRPAAGAPQMLRTAGSNVAGGDNSAMGSRLPCTPTSSPTAASRVEVHAPVETDHVAAGLAHERQQPPPSRCRSGSPALPGVSARSRARVRQDERAIVVGRQRADPRVEELHDGGAGGDLPVQYAQWRRRGSSSGGATRGRSRMSRLVRGSRGSAALDDVGGDGEGAPAKPMSGTCAGSARWTSRTVSKTKPTRAPTSTGASRATSACCAREGDDRSLALGELTPHRRLDDSKMSAKRIAASTPTARSAAAVTSPPPCGVLASSRNAWSARSARFLAGRVRPTALSPGW